MMMRNAGAFWEVEREMVGVGLDAQLEIRRRREMIGRERFIIFG